MDTNVSVRFYRISKPEDGRPDFHELLLKAVDGTTPGAREAAIGSEVTIRLESCTQFNGRIEGDFCRVQKLNIPPQAGTDGLLPVTLEDGHGLGHLAAFNYDPATRVLALQTNRQSASTNRIGLYLAARNAADIFVFQPVLTKDAMDRFKDKKPRSFTVTFAGVQNLEALDDDALAAARGAKMIAEAYDGVRVTVKVSVGRSKKKFLSKDALLKSLGLLSDADGVKKLSASVSDNGDNEEINFLKEHLQDSTEVTLSSDDPDKNYEQRRNILRKSMSDKYNSLKAQFLK